MAVVGGGGGGLKWQKTTNSFVRQVKAEAAFVSSVEKLDVAVNLRRGEAFKARGGWERLSEMV